MDAIDGLPSNYSFDVAAYQNYGQQMHILTSIDVVANALAFFLIVYRSPPSMATYRWYLLDIALCSMLLDVHLAVFFQPAFLFPAPVVCSLGLTSGLPPFYSTVLQLCFMFAALGMLIGSVLMAFIYRLLAVENRTYILQKPAMRAVSLVVHTGTIVPATLQFSLTIFDNDAVRLRLKQAMRFIPESCAVITHLQLTLTLITISVVVWMATLTLVSVLCFRRLKQLQVKTPYRNFRHEKQLLVALLAQVALPFATFACPGVTVVICTFVDRQSVSDGKFLIPLAMQLFLSHSSLNALGMIALTRPYRVAVLSFLRIKRPDDVMVTSVSEQLKSHHIFRRVSRSQSLRPTS